MEAARPLADANRDPGLELARLRPFGEAYLMRNFGTQLSHADAEDAVSDVTLRLHRQIAAGRPPENLQAAFLTGARNAAIDRLRHRTRKPTVELEVAAQAPTDLPAPEELAERREAAARMREVLLRISPRQRRALTLRFGLGLTVPEIAARMQVSLPAAKNLLARGIAQARRRHEAIAANRLCPQMQEEMKAALDRQLACAEQESEELRAHLEHCGSCKALLHSLRADLHQIGPAAALLGGGHLAAVHDLLARAGGALHPALAKAKLAAYRFAGPGTNGAASGGALAGAGQKVAALCGTAAATTCLATGVVGPGLGAVLAHQNPHHSEHSRPTQVRHLSDLPLATPKPEVVPEPQPTPAEPEPSQPAQSETAEAPPPEAEPAPSPEEEGEAEFGIEGSPPPPEAPPPSPPSGGSGGGSGGGGGESFGFGG